MRRRAGEGEHRSLDGKRGLLVAVVARVAGERRRGRRRRCRGRGPSTGWTNSYDVGPGLELDDANSDADLLVAGRRHAVELALADGAERPAGQAAADAEVLARVRRGASQLMALSTT